jgi:predicted amidohydrolase
MSTFAIAGVQMDLRIADNLDPMGREIARVRRRYPWVRMILFGELCAFGPRPELAQPMPGPAESYFCALARKHRLWLVPGTLYELAGDHIYNTAPVIDPQGRVVARYRKLFPFFPYEQGVSAGRDCVTFEVPGVGVFGLSICYDMWFPETTRTLAWMGAEVILHPTLTNTLDRDAELAIARASAVTNQCYFLDVNNAGELGYGRSILVGPEGDVVHEAGYGHEIMPVFVDLERVRRTRREGVHGLGQPLKSFRDTSLAFPVYAPGARVSPSLEALGSLAVPDAGDGEASASEHAGVPAPTASDGG